MINGVLKDASAKSCLESVDSFYGCVDTTGMESTHNIRWFVYDRDGNGGLERLPHTARMAGRWLGWDVECSCGWGTKQAGRGGMVKARVEEERVWHLWEHGINAGFLKPLNGRRAAEAWQSVTTDTTPLATAIAAPESE